MCLLMKQFSFTQLVQVANSDFMAQIYNGSQSDLVS